MGGRKWTDDELSIVRDGYANELPVSEIADKLVGRTYSSIKHIAQKHNFTDLIIRKNNVNYKAIYRTMIGAMIGTLQRECQMRKWQRKLSAALEF